MIAYTPFQELEVGHVFPDPPADFQVTDALVKAYIAATGDATAIPQEEADRRPAPPTLAAVYMLEALAHLRNPPGGIHTKQLFTFHRPAYVGDRLTTEVRILDKYVKKRRNHVVMEVETRNQDGELVTTARISRIWGKEA